MELGQQQLLGGPCRFLPLSPQAVQAAAMPPSTGQFFLGQGWSQGDRDTSLGAGSGAPGVFPAGAEQECRHEGHLPREAGKVRRGGRFILGGGEGEQGAEKLGCRRRKPAGAPLISRHLPIS